MRIEIDHAVFNIRLYKKVAYFKVNGLQDDKAVNFFINTVNEAINNYPYEDFATMCNIKHIILTSPANALKMNDAIRKIAYCVHYKHNAVVVGNRFLDIVKAFLFSFYLVNTPFKTKLFFQEDKAIRWLEELGYDMMEIKDYLQKVNHTVAMT
jgi:hypothetical protein